MSEYQERYSVSRLSYPNPTSGSASIKYQLKDDVDVNIKLYDVYGKMIRVLVNKKQKDGSYSFRTDLSGLPDGIYYCRIEVGLNNDITKISLVK